MTPIPLYLAVFTAEPPFISGLPGRIEDALPLHDAVIFLTNTYYCVIASKPCNLP
jgi:hypothetical protein